IKIKCKARRKAELLCLKTVFLDTICLKTLGESLQNTDKSQRRKALHEAAGPSTIPGSQIACPACTPHGPARAFPLQRILQAANKRRNHLYGYLAEGVGFEPTVPLQARRFSRPVP